MPVRGGSSAGGDHIVVSGAAPPGFTGAWTIQPYAVCANSSALPNYQIVPDTEFPASSSTAREFHVLCTGSKRAVGSGAAIVDGGREVGLTAYRTDEPRGLARAYGEEDASGFGDAWRLQAFAICADPLPNFSVQASLQPGPTGRQVCPTGSFVHGPGGGAGTGGFFLQRLVPTADLRQLEVSGTAVDPAVGVLLHFTCAP
jgi:hypothetical protein